MTFIPQVSSAIQIPVVAAGGIADGRGMAAAFMLGAEAIQMGTAFLVSKECTIHQNFKDLLIKADSADVVVTGRKTGHAVRCIENNLTKAFRALDEENAENEAYIALGTGAAFKSAREGDVVDGSVMAGQIVGLVNAEKTAAQIIQDVVDHYNRLRLDLLEIT